MGLKLKSDTSRDGSLIPFGMFVPPSAVVVSNGRTFQVFFKFRKLGGRRKSFLKLHIPFAFWYDWLISKNKNH